MTTDRYELSTRERLIQSPIQLIQSDGAPSLLTDIEFPLQRRELSARHGPLHSLPRYQAAAGNQPRFKGHRLTLDMADLSAETSARCREPAVLEVKASPADQKGIVSIAGIEPLDWLHNIAANGSSLLVRTLSGALVGLVACVHPYHISIYTALHEYSMYIKVNNTLVSTQDGRCLSTPSYRRA